MIQNQQQIGHQRKQFNKKIKTIESIGNFTQTTPQQLDRSIVQKRQIFYNNPFSLSLEDKGKSKIQDKIDYKLEDKGRQAISLSNISKISKIQSQVNDITKMKMMYQSRMNKDKNNTKNHNKSIDKGSSANKSIQKHILKPSNTPNFNKFHQQHKKQFNNQYFDQSKQDNNIVSQLFNGSKSISLQQNQIRNDKYSIYLPSSHKYNVNQTQNFNNYSKHSNYTQNNEKCDFGYQFQSSDIKQSQRNKRNSIYQMKLEQQYHRPKTPKKIDFESKKSSYQVKQNRQIKQNLQTIHKCSCQSMLRQYIEQTNQKMAQITQRLMYLQQQNQNIKILQQKMLQKQQQSIYLKEKIDQISHQNQQLRQSNLTQQTQKQQIEVILKDILFKRQRQKLHQQISKQNTQRSQKQKYQDFYNNQHQQQNQNQQQYSRKSIQPVLVKKNMNINKSIDNQFSEKKDNQNDSKLKVQSLLQKLQIKVQRS